MAGVVIHKSSATDVSKINLFQTKITVFQPHDFAVVYSICHPLEISQWIIIKIIALPIKNK